LFEGCGFVKYSYRDMALAAINALDGLYTMRVWKKIIFLISIILMNAFWLILYFYA